MELILWRHAEAAPGLSDLGRRLTDKGAHDARRMARWLRPRLPGSHKVVASPARRAQQTAATLTSEFAAADEIGAGASPDALLDFVLNLPAATIIVVGHQPTLGRLAAQLMSGRAADWGMKPGAIWWLTCHQRAGSEKAELRAMMSPEFLD